MKGNLSMMPNKKWFLFLLTSYALLLGNGCSPVGDINRVSSNYSKKTQFEGDWYMRPAVVDKHYNNASVFVGLECGIERVRFNITKDKLLVYRAYDKVPGTQPKSEDNQTLVAAFPITKHFDIRREYSVVTGVENNVIEENDFDRPWWERENVKIDWSNNLVSDSQCNDWIKTNSVVQMPGYSNTDRDVHHVRIEDDYMETTIVALANPDKGVCRHIGDWNCDGAEVKLKFSFKKIDPKNDYEKLEYPDYLPLEYGKTKAGELCSKGDLGCENVKPLWLSYSSAGAEICDPSRHNIDDCKEYDVPVFSRFGYFRTTRYHFDRESNFTLSGRKQYINRWNLWQQSTRKDKTQIPVKKRIPKPVIYYQNVGFPEDLKESSKLIAKEWDVAFSQTVARLKTNCTIDEYNNYVDVHRLKEEMNSKGFKVVTQANLNDACFALGEVTLDVGMKPPFLSGDYRQINRIYGPLFEIRENSCNLKAVEEYSKVNGLDDALTSNGIIIVTEANLEEACAVLEEVSKGEKLEKPFSWQRIGDLRYSFLNYARKAELAGPLGYGPSSSDPLTGEIVNANANIYGASIETYAAWGADVVSMLNGDLKPDDILNGSQVRKLFENSKSPSYLKQVTPQAVSGFESKFNERTRFLADSAYDVKLPFSSLRENWGILKESGFEERYLITDEMVRLFANDSTEHYSVFAQESIDQARPSNWAQGAQFNLSDSPTGLKTYMNKIEFMGSRNACFMANTLEPAIADLASKLKGKTWEEAYQFIKQNIFVAVTLHEVGHTLGLRHNFKGSTDALNFFPQFWDVDTHDHRMTDLTTAKEEMQYSSIMDYHQRFNSDFAGLGLYDKAAIKFGYGELVEVFDERDGLFVPRDWHNNVELFHYRDLPYLYSGDDVDEKVNQNYQSVKARRQLGDNEARVTVKAIGITPRAENLYRRRDVFFNEYHNSLIHRLFGSPTQSQGSFEVPYRYCSDAFASGGNLTCTRWDKGASVEEIVDNAAQMYESYYLFDAFRRDRLHFSPQSYMGRLYQRTFKPMAAPFTEYYRYHRTSLLMWPQMQDLATASLKGLNFFGRVLQTVEPGYYCLDGGVYKLSEEETDCSDGIHIGLDQGRYYDTHFSNQFFYKPENIGHMYDKLLAMQALTDSVTFLTKNLSAAVDREARSIGYYRVFAPEMIKLFSGILKGDELSFSPKIKVKDGEALIEYRPLIDTKAVPQVETAGTDTFIKASNSWIMRYYSLVFPMVNFTNNVDQQLDFAKRARVTLVGSKHDPIVDQSIKQIVFTDPLSKVQYRSLAPEGAAMAPGYMLLEEASSLVNDGSDNKPKGEWFKANEALTKAKANMETLKASTDIDSVNKADTALNDAKKQMKLMDSKLNQQVQLIDIVRSLGDLLDYGA